MIWVRWAKASTVLSAVTALALALRTGLPANANEPPSSVNCTFQSDPDEFLSRQARGREDVFERAGKLGRNLASAQARAVPANQIPRRNFIDDEVFGKLAGANVPAAPLAGDEEFFRRIYLDLIGRPPSPEEIRAFLADSSPNKRDAVIDGLLYSPEFVDRWAMWLGDLLENNSVAAVINRRANGRNAFHEWIRVSLATEKSLRDIVYECLTATGNNYENGPMNYLLGGRAVMGPTQDIYDLMFSRAATHFLGLAHYDCLLCHNGRGHLDQVSVWGARTTRMEAERMAAYFARIRLAQRRVQGNSDFYYQSFDVTDAPTGAYLLNTNFGNRPNRTPIGTMRDLTPEYRVTGATPSDSNWRVALAENLLSDPLFSRNLANRIWKHFFGLGLIDPVDAIDPARLDPASPPPAPWTLQPTHPVLFHRLGEAMEGTWYNLREFIRLIVQSSAYQLSSRYGAPWKLEYVPLFARHYPRRLEGEEIHDAIAQATGVPGSYRVEGWAEPAIWARQLPEPVEPRSNGAVAAFMNTFLRGNRDTLYRSQAGSILQQLNLMNDVFVLNRTRVAASPLLRAVSQLSNEAAVEELFLLFLSRRPSDLERQRALAHLGAATGAARNAAIEDLAWAAVNKVEFIFSY